MTQRIYVLSTVAILFFATTTFGQEKKDSPASPSDISVDQIKKATSKPAKQETDGKAADAKTGDAKTSDPKSSDAKSTDNSAPKPVAEGTPVAQPNCGSSESGCGCETCDPCDPCRKRCRGRILGRLRMMFSRRCCG